MALCVVNISDMKFSQSHEDVIVTYSLGSCLGLTAYDPEAGVGGLIHCLLPNSANNVKRAKKNPFMFVNTGVVRMVRELIELGADKDRLVFKAAGCADMRGDGLFNTGARNFEALLGLLEANDVSLAASNVGGTVPRTLFLHMDTGRTVVRSLGKETEL